jgi:RNA polymerase sigma factor (sigma-70 family)
VNAKHHAGKKASAREWSDERLVNACLNGDSDAWSVLVEKYKRLIFSVPIKRGLSREDASEVFQQVCLGLFSDLADLRDPKSLPAWLIKVSASYSVQWSRRQARYTPIEDGIRLRATAPENVEQVLWECEQDQMIRDAIQAVAPRCRDLIQLLFFECPTASYQEAAHRLGIAPGSVGFIRIRCLQKLRKVLEERGF